MPEIQVRKTTVTRIASLLMAAVVGGLVAAAAVAFLDPDDGGGDPAAVTTTVTSTDTSSSSATGSGGLSAGAVYRRSASAVVEVQAGNASGTGFVIDAEGHVVTNEHVVGEAQEVEVRFATGGEEQARVVATDPSTDLAVLEVSLTGHDVTPLQLGSSADVEVGDPVYAIGNPFGLERSFTAGIVSAVDRDIRAPNNFTINDAIQTDAPVNQGNSGGPLLDSSAQVIGVVSQIASETGGNVGIGYAVPSDTVREVVDALLRDGQIERAYLGVRLAETDDGVRLGQVNPGGPADKAGLENGDLVVAVGGTAVDSASDVQGAVSSRKPDEQLRVTVRRGDDERTVTVKLGTRPASAE
jgi:putative serine protease PepD